MTVNGIDKLVESYWNEADEALAGLGEGEHLLLNTANLAADAVWDRHIFAHSETFGGTEIGYAGALSSVAGTTLPTSGSPALDVSLAQACQDALNTFSDDLLGPVPVEDRLVYAQPILLENPIPVGVVLFMTREPFRPRQERLLMGYLRHLDTRMNLAEHVLKLRKEITELRFENMKLKGESSVPASVSVAKPDRAPADFALATEELARTVPSLDLFGIELPTIHFDEFCVHFDALTDRYLAILEEAPNLYLDVPSAIDAKDKSKPAAPYLRLLEVMGALRHATRLMYQASPEELASYAAQGRAPTFADLTRLAKQRSEDETVGRILDIMNDQGEEEEVDALYARSHPYEFRTANIGEVFALLALYRTVMDTMPESLRVLKAKILAALPKYQAAKSFLLSYDRFEDIPLRGAPRFQPPDSEKLLLNREKAPAFGTLLWAFRQQNPD